jgi:very-short-patch-repair endonuclease
MARHRRMTAHGIFVLHFTRKQIKTEPRRIVTEFSSAIAEGRRRPPLPIRTEPHQ